MTLLEFSRAQEQRVRERAAKVWRLMELNPLFDSEAAARRQLAAYPELRGVSLREFMGEVWLPGSFRNGCP